jgi:hypothetical protein
MRTEGRAVWPRRLEETFAVIAVADRVIELLNPKQHSLLPCGTASVRKVARLFTGNPSYGRLLGLVQIDAGVWLASRQYWEE